MGLFILMVETGTVTNRGESLPIKIIGDNDI